MLKRGLWSNRAWRVGAGLTIGRDSRRNNQLGPRIMCGLQGLLISTLEAIVVARANGHLE
jgi:hypothetical protein